MRRPIQVSSGSHLSKSYCQKRVAVTSLPLPRVPWHCQRERARFIGNHPLLPFTANALPLLTANLALFRVRLVAVTRLEVR
jgi:hypothetical protein